MSYYNPAQRTGNFLTSLFRDDESEKAPARPKPKAKPKVTTKKDEIRAEARRRLAEVDRSRLIPRNDLLASAGNALTLGIPEILAAGITAPFTDRSFSEELALNRERSRQIRGRSLTGNILGSVVGGTALARAGTTAVRAGAARAGTAVGGVSGGTRAARAARSATTLKRGQRVRNVAKLAAGGAAGGATEAALRGEDVGQGALIGTVASPILAGLGSGVVRILQAPAVLAASNAGTRAVLRRLTDTPLEQITAEAARRRADTGMEPTVFELLQPADQQRIIETVIGPNADLGSRAAQDLVQRIQEVSGGAQARMGQLVEPRLQQAQQEITKRLVSARGVSTPEDAALAAQAVRSPVELDALPSTEAKAIMAPFDNQIAVQSVDDLVPKVPVNNNGRISQQPDPEIQSIIRSVTGTAQVRGDTGITVDEITKIRRGLKKLVGRGDVSAGAAQRALDYVDDLMATNMPDAAAAIARMDEAFAGASRIGEGARVGAQTRLRDEFGRDISQVERNAFDTPEGATGRAIGQSNRLLSMFGGNVSETARAIRQVASSSNVRKALEANIGAKETEDIVRAARSFDDAINTLNKAIPRAENAGQNFDDIDAFVDGVTVLNPAAFPTAKMWAVRRLIRGTAMPERTAQNITDMLFSRDPNLTQRAFNMLNSTKLDAKSFRRDLGFAMMLGSVGSSGSALPEEVNAEPLADGMDAPEAQESGPWDDYAEPAEESGPWDDYAEPAEESGPWDDYATASGGAYDAQLEDLYQNADPQFLDLLQRVEQQESGGNPNAVSSAGAIGLMQVMPDTAPEAARLAGVPYDKDAYLNDPSYQRLIGAAYLQEMLRQFEGNVAHSLAAYNAGPGRVKRALASGKNWFSQMPAETQNYVRALM